MNAIKIPYVLLASATELPFPENHFDAVFTDPPYYDNVPYSYLSDFFYVWLKRTLGDLYPELFSTPLTRKSEKIVAYTNNRSWEEAKEYFEKMLIQSNFSDRHNCLSISLPDQHLLSDCGHVQLSEGPAAFTPAEQVVQAYAFCRIFDASKHLHHLLFLMCLREVMALELKHR